MSSRIYPVLKKAFQSDLFRCDVDLKNVGTFDRGKNSYVHTYSKKNLFLLCEKEFIRNCDYSTTATLQSCSLQYLHHLTLSLAAPSSVALADEYEP
jgi:hypothetical protein